MFKINLTVDTEELLKNISDITYTPIAHFIKCENVFELENCYPEIPLLPSLAKKYPKVLLEAGLPAKIAEIGQQTMLYGYVHLPDESFLILGPIIETALYTNSATKLLKKLDLPLSDVKNLLDYYDGTSHYSIYRFAKIVKFVCTLFNDYAPHTIDILPNEYKKIKIDNVEAQNKTPTDRDTAIVKSQKYERELYSYIYTGQYKKLKEFLDNVMCDDETAMYSPSVMRNNQYFVIISTTLASRTACLAGANYDTSMKKADAYLKKVDSAQSFNELVDIHKRMLLDFAKLVADSSIGKPASSLYSKTEDYILQNLHEKITTADIADALNMSRTYLSAHFKEETGKNLSDFINELKINEAKYLLITTDKTLIWIANSLCFSSQSYFAEVFKKFVKCTPKEFRENPINLRID